MAAFCGLCMSSFHGARSVMRPQLSRRFASFSLSSQTTQNAHTFKTPLQEVSHEDILSLCHTDHLEKALHALSNTHTYPSDGVYISLLKACIKKKSLLSAKQVLVHVGLHRSEILGLLGDYLVIALAKCGGMDDAWEVHHALQRRTISSWSAMICGYADCGKGQEALEMYHRMLDDGMEPDKYAYVSLFKTCGSIFNLAEGRKLHEEVKRRGLTSNIFIANTILSMYGKCGSIEEAEDVFYEMRQHNVVSWNAMLSGYIEQGEPSKALLLYRQMCEEGMEPNELTFVMAIQACCPKEAVEGEPFGKMLSLDVGQALHADAHKKGFTSHLLVASILMCMYGKYGDLAKAEGVFSRLNQQNVVTWTTMLKSYVEQGQGQKVLQLHRQMHREGLQLDPQAYVLFFQACCSFAEEEEAVVVEGNSLKLKALEIGQALHEDAKQRGFARDAYVGGTIVSMYGKCGSIIDAEDVFKGLSQQDIVSWNVMLSAYVDQGFGEEALLLYKKMVEAGIVVDERTAVSTLQACMLCVEQGDESLQGAGKALLIGQMLYSDVCRFGFTSNIFIGNTLINFYGKCGSLMEAEKVFMSLSRCDIATWNVMLCVYIEQGQGKTALLLYRQMLEEGVRPDERTFVITLQACSTLIDDKEATPSMESKKRMSLEIVYALHADAKKQGFSLHVFVANSLTTSYAKCGAVVEAESVFTALPRPSTVSWNAMLSAYIEQGKGEVALQLLSHMLKEGASPDPQTFVIALQASCTLEQKQDEEPLTSLYVGQAIHADAQRKNFATNVFVGNTLTRMYGKCGRLVEAVDVFNGLSQRNIVSWNAVLSGLAEQGKGDQALQIYKRMQEEVVTANDITLVCILQMCCETGHMEVCQHIHFTAVCSGLDMSTFVATTIVHAYGSCAGMADCQTVFHGLHEPILESWNAMLTGFGGEGNLVAILQSFEEMHCRGHRSNKVTFFALLMACSHTGLIERGLEFFVSMIRHCELCPEIKHYVIMVDLLGRAGAFARVESMLSRMPMQPDLAFWLCLLAACRVHGNVQLGKRAYSHALLLQPSNAAVYVSMSNIYADARRVAYTDVLEKAK